MSLRRSLQNVHLSVIVQTTLYHRCLDWKSSDEFTRKKAKTHQAIVGSIGCKAARDVATKVKFVINHLQYLLYNISNYNIF